MKPMKEVNPVFKEKFIAIKNHVKRNHEVYLMIGVGIVMIAATRVSISQALNTNQKHWDLFQEFLNDYELNVDWDEYLGH
jgi:hypothetical protein